MNNTVVKIKKGITTKDFAYWIIFLVAFNIFVLSGRLSDNVTVLNYLSFSGTLVGIILAIIAIIYSYFQSSSFETTKSKLDDSVIKIENASNSLDKVSKLEELTQSISNSVIGFDENLKQSIFTIQQGVNEVSSTLQGRLNDLLNTVEGQVTNLHSSVEQTRTDIMNVLITSRPQPSESLNTKYTLNTDFITNTINSLTNSKILIMYFLYLSKEHKKALNLQIITSWLIENNYSAWSSNWLNDKNEVWVHYTSGYVFSLLELMYYYNWITLDVNTITDINSESSEVVSRRIEKNQELHAAAESIKQVILNI